MGRLEILQEDFRVAELFEARKPTNPAVMSEIGGSVKFGETKRGVRKIHITGVDGEERTYSVPYGKHVIVHEGDHITAGTNLCECHIPNRHSTCSWSSSSKRLPCE